MPTIRRDFPVEVETIDPQWIVLKDGTRIAVTMWKSKSNTKVPVVVEMVPYRRRDGTMFRDLEIHPYIAGEGIACCRVDLRGSGDSGGVLRDEYLPWRTQTSWSAAVGLESPRPRQSLGLVTASFKESSTVPRQFGKD